MLRFEIGITQPEPGWLQILGQERVYHQVWDKAFTEGTPRVMIVNHPLKDEEVPGFKGWVEADPDFEVLAPVHFGTVCFRAHPKGMNDEQSLSKLNDDLINAVNGSRETFLSHTKLGDQYTIRMVIGHLKTQESHASMTWQKLQQELKTLMA